MPSRTANRKKTLRKQNQIDLDSIIQFIRFIQAIACGILGISIIGMLLTQENKGAKVVYVMVIIVNLVIILSSTIGGKYLDTKNQNLR